MINQRFRILTVLIVSLLLGSFVDSAGAMLMRRRVGIPKVSRDKVICFALYTVQDGVMKMTAQLYPLEKGESRVLRLEVMRKGKWVEIAHVKIDERVYGIHARNPGYKGKEERRWTGHFRVAGWDQSQDVRYRVAHGANAFYEGLIRKDPKDKETIVVAAFTGNSNGDRGMKPDIIHNIKAHNPDLLFFSGDQSYDHKSHLAAWLLFGRQFGQIMKDRPTICIPDDHDVGQGNLWGAGGKVSHLRGGADGGYTHPGAYVKSVENAQTSHLPDPYDATPIGQGIGVYYTSLNVGGVDFAIIEDRKFKTGPAGLVPRMGKRPDHITDPRYDPKKVDVKGAVLLGNRQLAFLEDWSTRWQGVEMKSVLSQTVFANAAHIHHGERLIADMDSNGWPQTGRNKALKVIRKGYAFMIGGDQHLATFIHHGVNAYNDSGYSFCVPSIVNYYPRAWMPLVKGINPVDPKLKYSGSYLDGFGNKMTMYAYANPNDPTRKKHDKWRARGKWGRLAAGHGIIRFNKKTRKITAECWPRGVDVTKKNAKQFLGWPVTVTQEDNYGRKGVAMLPPIIVRRSKNVVVQIINEATGEVVYTLRTKGKRFMPKVFVKGKYTVKLRTGIEEKIFKHIPAPSRQRRVFFID